MAEPFLGVALPDTFSSTSESAPAGGDTAADTGAPAGATEANDSPAGGDGFEVGNAKTDEQVSKEATASETTKSAVEQLLDLDKHERFRWQGREMTRKDLSDGMMMRGDYSRKTAELAEARKYADNFEVDLPKVIDNPDLLDQFKKVYPPAYVKVVERILALREPKPTNPEAPSQGGTEQKPPDLKALEKLVQEKLAPVLSWKEHIEQSVLQANTEKSLQWLDTQHEKLKAKYPFGSDKEVDFQLSAYLDQQGAKGQITDKLMETLYKKSHEEREAQFKAHYKKQVEEQKAANSKAKDVGAGASAGTKVATKRTMAEAKKALLERFES